MKAVIFISMEAVAAIYTLIVLAFHLQHRNRSMTKLPLTILLVGQLLLMLCQIGEWSTGFVTITYGESTQLIQLATFLNVLDFMLYSLSSVFYFQYVISVIGEAENHPNKGKKLLWVLFTLSLLSSLGFALSVWTGWFFTVDSIGMMNYNANYYLLVAVNMAVILMTIVLIVRNSRILGLSKIWIYLAYPLVPMLLIPFDQVYNLAFSYIASAIVNTLLYLGADLARERELLKKEAALAQHEAKMSETKMELMMSQLQPHFIYNALSSIAYLCTEDPAEAEKATTEFAGYLRGNLQNIGSKMPIPFDMELNHVEQYLKLEKRRFPDRLRVVYDIREREFNIPALTLQTLVENAVRYGVNARYTPTTVTISSEQTGGEYIVRVADDGPGFDTTATKTDNRRHIGIEGSRNRIREMVGGYLDVSSVMGKGTTATIHIPKERKA